MDERRRRPHPQPLARRNEPVPPTMLGFVGLSDDNKERISKAIEVAKTIVHYGWIPTILFVAYRASNPRPPLMRLISPLA
ncbi:hypothetical protein NBRC10512_002047 [Rhodotorula toruloides]|uniref:RHTO0S02e07470g1_1 n=2 Tax=Rhodotorula toruloides TaxID=5286 RepID=A0A061AQ40_RHOTO|nr:mitochondrial outer membrane translocase complex, subunit Tom7 [Rhodotorula toruloides NP11]EMS19122.1 mitochondrial outer membrane translocase complex, subunit Tom7 [Rhodotorula toruloides NP11]CDR36839.1 RHTO0S02e07470g1_1 [Rhodotorula toruloides]